MTKKSGLGRGLDALLGGNSSDSRAWSNEENSLKIDKYEKSELDVEKDGKQLLNISIFDIDPNPEQPRKQFDEEALKELSNSIAHSGVIQPLLVQQKGERYIIVAGERRWRAAQLANLHEVPAIIQELDDATSLEYSLIENLQREDLNPVEEAKGIKLLMNEQNLTQEKLAKVLGKSRPAIANALRLLTLPDDVLTMLEDSILSSGHGRALVALDDAQLQREAAKEIAEKKLSVRETEKLCKRLLNPVPKKEKFVIPEVKQAQFDLQNRLETRVAISGDGSRGKIMIDYYSKEQLEALYEHLNRD